MGGDSPLSLLWPSGEAATAALGRQVGDEAAADLRVPELVAAMVHPDSPPGRRAGRERFARQVLTGLITRPEVITHRQAVLADILDNATLRERLEAILPALEAVADVPRGERYRPTAQPELERVARRLTDLELLVDVVRLLSDALADPSIHAEGFRWVGRQLQAMRQDAEFAALERELPRLRATLASVRSVVVGVNLGPDLAPQSATILELRDTPIEGRRSLLWRLLGGSGTDRGVTALQRGEASPLGRPNELVRDLRHLLGQVIAPVHAALERFAHVSTDRVARLGPELAFFLGAAHLFHRLQAAGLPVSRPTCAAIDERRCEVVDAYDPTLALAQSGVSIVTNGVRFDAECGRVWVLTGPNRGGKTTYTRCVGLLHVLFQAGLCVPAVAARISPADGIYTHFPTREDSRSGLGRLDAEAERLAAIFQQATPHSLILLNEALAGTSALEALDLARGLVRGLRLLGARAIYVTHLHELATSVDAINASTPGDGTVASLLADSDNLPLSGGAMRRSYRIVPHAPRGVSFAGEIAEQHGISYPQIEQLLRTRHLA